MSSSLSELRNFRLNKANGGASSSNKLATGRKRIRAMSDSSDDDTKKQPTPTATPTKQTPTQNGTTEENKLNVKDKEERYHLFRQIVDKNVDSLVLQDFLVRNDWDVQKAYDAIQESPNYRTLDDKSPPKIAVQLPAASPSKSDNPSPEVVKVVKAQKQRVRISSNQMISVFCENVRFIFHSSIRTRNGV